MRKRRHRGKSSAKACDFIQTLKHVDIDQHDIKQTSRQQKYLTAPFFLNLLLPTSKKIHSIKKIYDAVLQKLLYPLADNRRGF